MSQKELQRIKVVENAVEGRLSVVAAAELLQLSDRQVKRLKQNYDDADPNWVHHGNWGRQPANAIPQDTRSQVIELAAGRYAGFNDSHLHEKLLQAEGLVLSRPSVQRILRQAGIRSPQKRRSPKYHSRRERRAQEGMLLQVDGSRHDWLEGRGLPLTLLGGAEARLLLQDRRPALRGPPAYEGFGEEIRNDIQPDGPDREKSLVRFRVPIGV